MTRPPWSNLDPRRRCIKPSDWPAGDRAAWDAARAPGDVLEPGGPACHWRPATVASEEHDYGRFLTWLDLEGLLDPAGAPAERVTPERIDGFIQALRTIGNAPATVATRVKGLLVMMRAVAPKRDFAWLDRLSRALDLRAIPSRNKAARVVPAGELVDLGFRVMKDAENAGSPIEAAARRQHGLMIALLAFVPVRRGNFASITIERHLRKVGEEFKLVFPGEEMKNHEPLEAPVPRILNDALERHLAIDRPLLAARSGTARARRRPAGDALWISRFGSALSAARIYAEINALTKAHFGHAINLHLFRACGATTVANDDPAHVGSTKNILGHRSDKASAKYYNFAQAAEAARAHQDLISAMRSGRG